MNKRTLHFAFMVLWTALFLIVSCSKEKDDSPEPVQETPTVKSFNPPQGKVGAQVTISGINFSATKTENTVKFGSATATVTAASTTSLTTSVPDGAQTGKISVTVNGITGTSANDFTVLPNETQGLEITSISTESGTVGTQVTITGTGFSTTTTENTVKFGGDVIAEVDSASATQLVVTVPEGATDGKISITVDGTTVQSANTFTIIPDGEGLQIASLSVTQGTVGTQVTITGTGFSTTTTENTVKFGADAVAEVTSASETQLVVTVPEGATNGKISVTVDGTTVQSADSFTVLLPLEIQGISPLSGPVGTEVTIDGTGFSTTASENTVEFGGDVTAQVNSVSTTQLVVTVPDGAIDGKISVTVGEDTVESLESFTILATVQINNFSPQSGQVGTEVAIMGMGFSTVPGETTVNFGSTSAEIVSVTSTEIKVLAPLPTGASAPITVSVGSQEVTHNNDFTYLAWRKAADFPGEARVYSLAESINGIVYAGLGRTSDFIALQDFYAYDPATNTWTQKTSFPGGGRYGAFSFVLNNKIYVGGGTNGSNTIFKDLYSYDPNDNTWTKMSDMNGPNYIIKFATAVVLGNSVTVFGGIDNVNTVRNDMWTYTGGTWNYEGESGTLPERYLAASFTINDKAYIGIGKTTNTSATNIFHNSTNGTSWTGQANYLGSLTYAAVAGVIDGKAYVGMGFNNFNVSDDRMFQYNPQNDTWIQKTKFSDYKRNYTWDAVANGKMYIGCGVSPPDNYYTKDVYVYDPFSDFTNN